MYVRLREERTLRDGFRLYASEISKASVEIMLHRRVWNLSILGGQGLGRWVDYRSGRSNSLKPQKNQQQTGGTRVAQ